MGHVSTEAIVFPNQGLPVVKLAPDTANRHSTLYDVHNDQPLTDVGTLGCFIYCRTKENHRRCWAVTSGHVFIERGNCKCQEGDKVVAQPRAGNMLILTDSYYASLRNIQRGSDLPQFLDASVFEIDRSELSNLDVSISCRISQQCYGKNLMDREVWKAGQSSGKTYGRIIDIDAAFIIGDDWRLGMFVVASLDGQPFAIAGDSGSAVIDRATNEVLGFVTGVLDTKELEHDYFPWSQNEYITFCIQTATVVQYILKCNREMDCENCKET